MEEIQKAYKNNNFLTGSDARAIRVLCEFLEPEARFKKFNINNTVIFFGSARILPEEQANELLITAQKTNHPQKINQAQAAVRMAKYYQDAHELAYKLTKWSMTLEEKYQFYVTSGGGPGIMEAVNKGAKDAGGKSIGMNISLPFEQHPNPYQDQECSFEFHYFFIRKFWFAYLAKALIAFPGGFGTCDELFELLTLIQTKKLEKTMPVILYDSSFWNKIINFKELAALGMIAENDLELFHFIDTPDDAFEFLKTEIIKHMQQTLNNEINK